jgi:hypothetical protein
MPIRNMGTLLENVVLVEAMRAFAQANPSSPIDFLNSFAMPPLSGWCPHRTASGFSAAQLNALQVGQQPTPPESYQGMLWSCLQQPPGQPGILGPNGAILCRMLALLLRCPIRLWLNDIPNGHYGNALPGLTTINAIAQQVLALPATPSSETLVCGEPWPDSLTHPTESSLTHTLTAWTQPAHARIGFLDPTRYRISNGLGGETDSFSHRQWLLLLASDDACPVISVHFTGHNHWPTLRSELQSMHEDGVATGYPHTLVACHSYYHVVCNIRSPKGPEATHALAVTLKQMVQAAWTSWFQTIRRHAAAALVVEVR